MDRDTLWGHTHHERIALAATLRTLTPEQWEHDSLCEGWTVKDVAAHVIRRRSWASAGPWASSRATWAAATTR